MTVFEDVRVLPLERLCKRLRHNLKEWGFLFETVRQQPYPQHLPPEVLAAYESERIAIAELEFASAELDAA